MNVDLVVDTLAAVRLTRLVVHDTITEPLRAAIEARSVAVEPNPDSPVGRLVDVQPWAFLRDVTDCGWCTGVWMGAGVVAARTLAPRAWRPVATALAMAAVAGYANRRP